MWKIHRHNGKTGLVLKLFRGRWSIRIDGSEEVKHYHSKCLSVIESKVCLRPVCVSGRIRNLGFWTSKISFLPLWSTTRGSRLVLAASRLLPGQSWRVTTIKMTLPARFLITDTLGSVWHDLRGREHRLCPGNIGDLSFDAYLSKSMFFRSRSVRLATYARRSLVWTWYYSSRITGHNRKTYNNVNLLQKCPLRTNNAFYGHWRCHYWDSLNHTRRAALSAPGVSSAIAYLSNELFAWAPIWHRQGFQRSVCNPRVLNNIFQLK